mmetsp:Transcript_11033/g.31184  ORF Transcript_11033/g.31184 Transcript_11033/m.31184 type:complete len:290 (+) Transcript_11033:309-1178(+)
MPTDSNDVEVTAEMISTVRDGMSEEFKKKPADADVARFIRAVQGDLPHAIKRINDTYAWRKKHDVEMVVCQACLSNPRSHYMHVVGHDLKNQPVIYSVFSLAEDKNPDENKKHMIHQFETAVRLMGEGAERWVWVMDFHGFGLPDCNPKIAKIFLGMTSAHYPERLSHIIVIGAPGIFNGLWGMLKPMIPDVTKQKIMFVPYDLDHKSQGKELRGALAPIFGPELLEWLCTEMSDSREKVKQHIKKVYSLSDLQNLPPEGIHDPRGTPSFVKKLAESSHLLTGHQSQER